jgi:hypothetical protein
MLPVGKHNIQPWAAEHATPWPRLPWPKCFIIGVEQIVKGRIENTICRRVRTQQHRLEKPGGMPKMPFGGTGIRHGLDALVFGAQCGRQAQGVRPNLPVSQPNAFY